MARSSAYLPAALGGGRLRSLEGCVQLSFRLLRRRQLLALLPRRRQLRVQIGCGPVQPSPQLLPVCLRLCQLAFEAADLCL